MGSLPLCYHRCTGPGPESIRACMPARIPRDARGGLAQATPNDVRTGLSALMPYPATLLAPGRLEYAAAWRLQQSLVAERLADRRPDTLLLVEHEPVYTIGRTGRDSHWGGDEALMRRTGTPLFHVERGGSVTFHGPGQLVGYPILQLRRYCAGPKAYMQRLGEVLIRTVAAWDIAARWDHARIGVWVGEGGEEKIAALGVRVDRGVTMHGFALNVNVDLTPFSHITPCGIERCRVTSMAQVLGRSLDLEAVRRQLLDIFAQVFDVCWTLAPSSTLEPRSRESLPMSTASWAGL